MLLAADAASAGTHDRRHRDHLDAERRVPRRSTARRRPSTGCTGYLGTYVGALQSLGRVQVRVLHVRHDRDVYLIAGLAPVDDYPQVVGAFSKSLQSFRGLSPADAESIRPNRISLYTARSGDTWQGIAEASEQRHHQGLDARHHERPPRQRPAATRRAPQDRRR